MYKSNSNLLGLESFAGSHEAAVLRLLFQVLQRGLGFVFQLVHVHVLDVGQLAQHGLLVRLLLVVFSDHLGQLRGQLHVIPRLLDLGLIQLVLRWTQVCRHTEDTYSNKGLKFLHS